MINTTAQKTQTKPLAAISAAKEVSTVRSLSASTRRIEEAKPTSETSNTGTVKSLTDIARKHDVRSISPRDMATMSQELYQSGAISPQEHVLLSFQPELNPESSKTLAGAYAPDAPKDFIAQWEAQLRIHKSMGEANFAKNDQRILSILHNLAALHESATPA